MEKSPDAFRTISEVSDLLETPAHVLRFWESRFPQIKPVKRAGGRRYYRPSDVALIAGIRRLLHQDGLTIRGVQKMLRDQGVRHVAALSEMEFTDPPDEPDNAFLTDADSAEEAPAPAPVVSLAQWRSPRPDTAPPPDTGAKAEVPLQQASLFDPPPVMDQVPVTDPAPVMDQAPTEPAPPEPAPDESPDRDPLAEAGWLPTVLRPAMARLAPARPAALMQIAQRLQALRAAQAQASHAPRR